VITPIIDGARVYDLFAGTGSMGLECLSRGAAYATFFEADRSALTRLTQNIMAVQVAERSRVISGDLFRWFERTNTRPTTGGEIGANLAFLDPPYRFLTDRPDELLQLTLHLAHAHLTDGATVIFRHDVHNALELPNLEKYDQREYGDMAIELLRFSPSPSGRGLG
jgi:16S rRNA (guanine966-N2)-methyltransferase